MRKKAETFSSVAKVFAVLGIVILFVSILLGYASRSLFDSEIFADRVAGSLSDPRISSLVSERATESIIAYRRDLLSFKPLLKSTIQSLVASDTFQGMVRRGVRTSHSTVMSGRGENILLNLSDLGIVLRNSLSQKPELLKKIPSRIQSFVTDSKEIPGLSTSIHWMRVFRNARIRGLPILAFSLLLMALAVFFSQHRVRMLLTLSRAVVIGALVLLILIQFGGKILSLSIQDPLLGQAVAGLWDTFLATLRIWLLVITAIGLVLMSVSNTLLESGRARDLTINTWKWLTSSPDRKLSRALRGIVLLVFGIAAILDPVSVVTILIIASGIFLSHIGLRELFSIILGTESSVEGHPKPASRPQLNRLAWGSGIAILLIGIGAFILGSLDATERIPKGITTCNGHSELCDRSVDQVVFPASHNSMSSGDIPNWMFPNQERGIASQLDEGVRALLFDVHYGVPVGDKIKTVLENESAARTKYEAFLGKEGVDAAMRIRDRLIGGEEEEPGIYMCHGFCELGASPLIPALEQIREFLVINPQEVLILVIQDEGVTPKDLEKCFQDSGLIEYVYRNPATPPWLILRNMIASDQRVLVTTENNHQGVDWIYSAFEVMQETPYKFHNPSEFSCKPNRGGTSGSLFLMNHWIETAPAPKPSNAAKVNAYDFLLARALKCKQERGRLPNLIAVDFYGTGDLIKVTDSLNGFH